MSGSAQPGISADVARLADELYVASGAAAYGVSAAEFARTLAEVAHKYLLPAAGPEETGALLRALRIEELALARACAAGNEAAWEVFLTRYREKLYGAAYAIARDDATAHELADSLYADLYGTAERGGRRLSKLNSYMGRGSLEGWLRTVLAQEYVNRYRSGRRLVSLDEQAEAGTQFAAPDREPAPVADPRLEAATDEALGGLAAEDRFIVAAYFLDGRTLAEIARMLNVHESTVSRKLDKALKTVRRRIRENLVARGMSRRQADEALETDVQDLTVNVRGALTQETAGRAFSQQEVAELDAKSFDSR